MKPLPKLSAVDSESSATSPDSATERHSPMDRAGRPESDWRSARGIKAAALGLALVGAAVAAWAHLGSRSLATLPLERVRTAEVGADLFAESVPLNGRLVPEQTVYLDSVEGGRVVAVHVEEGTPIVAGQPIVTLKNTDLELEVMGREAQYTEQLSNLARAQIEFDQTSLRYDQELADAALAIELSEADLERRSNPQLTGVPRSVIETLQTELAHQRDKHALVRRARDRDRRNSQQNLDQLEESVLRMKQSLDILRNDLDRLSVTAPLTGQLTTLDVQVGQVIAPGERLGQVDKLDAFRVTAQVDEFYLGRLAAGQLASAELNGEQVTLRVRKIYPNVENRRFAVDLVFVDELVNRPNAGQTLRLTLDLNEPEDIVAIPNGAFLEQSAGRWVFVLTDDGKRAVRRDVELGRRNADVVEVLQGLAPGDTVLTSSYAAFLDKSELHFN